MSALHDPTTATVLAHAVRRWEAEVENARRLSNRENGILGVIAMLLGLGLFREPEARSLEPVALFWFTRALLATSVLQVLAALGLVLWIRKPSATASNARPPVATFASARLTWPGAPRHMKEVILDEREANLIAIDVMTSGANELLARNVRRKRLMDTSQRFLFAAAACASLAMTCYHFLRPTSAS